MINCSVKVPAYDMFRRREILKMLRVSCLILTISNEVGVCGGKICLGMFSNMNFSSQQCQRGIVSHMMLTGMSRGEVLHYSPGRE